jgi:hypothetical protein
MDPEEAAWRAFRDFESRWSYLNDISIMDQQIVVVAERWWNIQDLKRLHGREEHELIRLLDVRIWHNEVFLRIYLLNLRR